MKDMETIKATCGNDCKRSVWMLAGECPHKECVLWPYRMGKQVKLWPNRFHPKQFSPKKALAMYREGLGK